MGPQNSRHSSVDATDAQSHVGDEEPSGSRAFSKYHAGMQSLALSKYCMSIYLPLRASVPPDAEPEVQRALSGIQRDWKVSVGVFDNHQANRDPFFYWFPYLNVQSTDERLWCYCEAPLR